MSSGAINPIPTPVRFALAGISGCMATSTIQPIDLVKTRLQIDYTKQYRNGVHCLKEVVRSEGFFGLYSGLSAALARQLSYGMFRMALFQELMERSKGPNGENPNFTRKLLCGLTAGGLSSLIGNPTEVCLVRMTADGRLPVEQRRNYKNVVDALLRITKEEGITTLWRGCSPTIVRAMCLNMAQFGTYTQVKQILLENYNAPDNFLTHIQAATCGGVMASIASLPADNIKSKIQNMSADPKTGEMPFKSPIDCLVKSVKNNGVTSLWKGLPAYVTRISPHAILVLIIMEQLTGVYKGISNN